MNDIAISFCIPTYNRAQGVYKQVTDILKCSDSDIEVVVLDNGSTDETLNILRAIKDDRLFVYGNGENKGVLYNALHVINKGKGKFVFFSLDKDCIDPKAIGDFKLFLLRDASLACGYCEHNSQSKAEFELFSKGYPAVKEIAYKAQHPTGYFFNNKLLKSTNFVERFSDQGFVDTFPFDFVFAELCLLGDGAIYHKPMCTLQTVYMAAKQKSFGTNGKSKDAYFLPQGKLKMAINFTRHINTLKLPAREKELLIIDRFMQGLVAATMGYKSMMKSNEMCTHYHMESRNVGWKEMFVIGLNFYKQFIKGTRSVWGGNLLTQSKFIIHLSITLFRKAIKRFFIAARRFRIVV